MSRPRIRSSASAERSNCFWNWTWDQHVQYDLPAQLLFISTETNQPVHCIGVSQAATVGVAAATDHETAQMIRSLTLIGPTAYRGYTNSVLLEAWAYYFGLTIDSEYYETGFQNGMYNYSSEFPETGPYSAQGLSNTAIALISGPNCCLGSAPTRFVNGWDGTTSYKNLLQWQQGIVAYLDNVVTLMLSFMRRCVWPVNLFGIKH
ncbi:hypothetical protein M758_2G154800 [Ceratodon purpureus]|nr:hypothetical protein M758_2G154800 [Ceratodon purpureus]